MEKKAPLLLGIATTKNQPRRSVDFGVALRKVVFAINMTAALRLRRAHGLRLNLSPNLDPNAGSPSQVASSGACTIRGLTHVLRISGFCRQCSLYFCRKNGSTLRCRRAIRGEGRHTRAQYVSRKKERLLARVVPHRRESARLDSGKKGDGE